MDAKVLRKKYAGSQGLSPSPLKLIPAFSHTHISSHFQLSSLSSFSPPARHNKKGLQFALFRLELQWITGFLAGISLATSIGSYWTLDLETPSVTAVLCMCSLVQMLLILSYWALEGKAALLTSRAVGAVGRKRTSRRRILCGLECLLHLLIPIPRDFLVAGIQANYIAYLILLSRNYHFLRFLFWISPFSSLRAYMFGSFLKIDCLVSQHYLRKWSAVCAGIAILSLWLLLIATLGQEAANTGLKALVRLGEGHSSPSNPSEQGAILVCACIGLYPLALVITAVRQATALTGKEAQLSAQLYPPQTRPELRIRAAQLLQAWWRLVRMRHRHCFDLWTVFTWYRTLLEFLRLKPHPSARIGYSFYSHFAAVERELEAKIKRVRVQTRISARLDIILQSETAILEKTNYLAGRRKHITLPSRLSTIKEAEREYSPSVQSPSTNCYF